jgi:hypothetical protein
MPSLIAAFAAIRLPSAHALFASRKREINTATLVLPLDPLHHDLLNFVPLYSAVRQMPIRLKSTTAR